jgi:hypothetical protein
LVALVTACAGVDTLTLTERTFPPRTSAHDLEVLERDPICPHILLADLSMRGESSEFTHMQSKILAKAATLGADAVVFRSQSWVQHQAAYQTYPAWSLGGWMYGSYPYGYGYYGGWPVSNDVSAPHEVSMQSIKGTAIRYLFSPRAKC